MHPRLALLEQQRLGLIHPLQRRAHIQIKRRQALATATGRQSIQHGLKLVEVIPMQNQRLMAAMAFTPTAPLSRGIGGGMGLSGTSSWGCHKRWCPDQLSIHTGASPSSRKRKRLQALACCNHSWYCSAQSSIQHASLPNGKACTAGIQQPCVSME